MLKPAYSISILCASAIIGGVVSLIGGVFALLYLIAMLMATICALGGVISGMRNPTLREMLVGYSAIFGIIFALIYPSLASGSFMVAGGVSLLLILWFGLTRYAYRRNDIG